MIPHWIPWALGYWDFRRTSGFSWTARLRVTHRDTSELGDDDGVFGRVALGKLLGDGVQGINCVRAMADNLTPLIGVLVICDLVADAIAVSLAFSSCLVSLGLLTVIDSSQRWLKSFVVVVQERLRVSAMDWIALAVLSWWM